MSPGPEVSTWLAEPLQKDVARALERLTRADDVRRVAVMPDVHLAEGVCVGMVVATRALIYPRAVGSDIGCGMVALRFDGPAGALEDATAAAAVLDGLHRLVPAMRHGRTTLRDALPAPLDGARMSHPRLERVKRRDGRVQFATLGRGNHFLELQRDEEGMLWLMLHSGSRALGRAVFEHHEERARAGRAGLRALAADSAEGRAYLVDLGVALAYADASRRAMLEAAARVVRDVLGLLADEGTLVACHHNHVARERHGDEWLFVHRKGAIPAGRGTPGIVPGSMGTSSYHVEGRGAPGSLGSSAHGAGRTLSRGAARRAVTLRDFRRQVAGVWYDHRLAARLLDEAPAAYKDVTAVMRAQKDLTRIVRRLDPVLSYKGA